MLYEAAVTIQRCVGLDDVGDEGDGGGDGDGGGGGDDDDGGDDDGGGNLMFFARIENI